MNIKFKNIIKKFIVSLAGVITFLLLLEIILRIIGAVNLREHRNQLLDKGCGSDFIILCLGDSFTFGAGASSGKDYPAQLEGILNSTSVNKKFKVINIGQGSYNTAQILREFRNILQQGLKPDLVTCLGGSANYWNYWGYQTYLKSNNFISAVNDFLYRVRIYKLAKILFLNIKDKIENKLFTDKIMNHLSPQSIAGNSLKNNHGGIYKDSRRKQTADLAYFKEGSIFCLREQYDQAIECFKKAIEINPGDSHYYAGVGFAYNRQRKYDEAIKWLKKGIEINPRDSNCYAYLGLAYRSLTYSVRPQYDQAIECFKKALEINPRDSQCYIGLGFSYKNKGDYEKALTSFKKAIELKPRNPVSCSEVFSIYSLLGRYQEGVVFLNKLAKDNLAPEGVKDMLKKRGNREDITQEVKRWITSDIEKIINLSKENGIKILLLDYPRNPELSDLLGNIAKTNSVLFVSNYQVFSKLNNSAEGIDNYFVPDGHCNETGYSIMAKNIYDKIIEYKITDMKKLKVNNGI